MHARALIREAIRERLTTIVDGAYPTDAGDRVMSSRITPIDDEDLPAVIIYAREEKIDAEHGFGADGEDSYTVRDLVVVTEAIVRGGDTVDDKLDAIAEQLEASLSDWEIPGFESARVRLTETQIDVVTEGFKRPIGAVGLVWHVRYMLKWRPRPDESRPFNVFLSINDSEPEPFLQADKGLGNP